MPSLLDQVSFNMDQRDQQQTAGADELQRVAHVAATGKARGQSAVPQRSKIALESAQQAGKAAVQEARIPGEIQSAQLRGQEEAQTARYQQGQDQMAQERELALKQTDLQTKMQLDDTSAQASRQLDQIAQKYGMTKDNILTAYEQKGQMLSDREDAAELEQVSFLLGMQDKGHMAVLNRMGAERKLSQDINFAEEANRLAMGEEMTALMDELGWKEGMLYDDLAFQENLSNISIEEANAISSAAVTATANKAMVEGGVGITKAGINLGMDYKNKTGVFKPTGDATASTTPPIPNEASITSDQTLTGAPGGVVA